MMLPIHYEPLDGNTFRIPATNEKNISFEEEENQTKKTVLKKKNTRVFRRIRCV